MRSRFGYRFIDIGTSRCVDVLTIVKIGWDRARGEVTAKMPEVEMNYHLLSGMVEAVNARVVRSHRRISVLPGTESRNDPAMPAGFTDISVHLREIRERSADHGPHAVIECKRVAGNDATLCRRYVVDGIDDRFIGAKYAVRHRVAFMAGYVLSGSADAAIAGINRYLRARNRIRELLTPCTVLSAAWARSSSHPRPAPAIELHHAFLIVPASP